MLERFHFYLPAKLQCADAVTKSDEIYSVPCADAVTKSDEIYSVPKILGCTIRPINKKWKVMILLIKNIAARKYKYILLERVFSYINC